MRHSSFTLLSFSFLRSYTPTVDRLPLMSWAYPTGHPLSLMAMDIFSTLPFHNIRKLSLGPYAVKKAIDLSYNVSGALDRKQLLCRGVYLYQEITLPSSHPMMANRTSSKSCGIAFSGMDENQAVRGFSRVKQHGTTDQLCRNDR